MDAKHYNELIELSQEVYDRAREKLSEYLSAQYGEGGKDTVQQQMEDYLFVTVETSAYFLGNALALLEDDSIEEEIRLFTENLRRVIRHAQQQAGNGIPPS